MRADGDSTVPRRGKPRQLRQACASLHAIGLIAPAFKLTCVEAVAAALYIVGLGHVAEQLLSKFGWGHSFWEMNACVRTATVPSADIERPFLERYQKCDTPQSVVAEQDAIVAELKEVDDARRTPRGRTTRLTEQAQRGIRRALTTSSSRTRITRPGARSSPHPTRKRRAGPRAPMIRKRRTRRTTLRTARTRTRRSRLRSSRLVWHRSLQVYTVYIATASTPQQRVELRLHPLVLRILLLDLGRCPRFLRACQRRDHV